MHGDHANAQQRERCRFRDRPETQRTAWNAGDIEVRLRIRIANQDFGNGAVASII
jgi:hypothetical protein